MRMQLQNLRWNTAVPFVFLFVFAVVSFDQAVSSQQAEKTTTQEPEPTKALAEPKASQPETKADESASQPLTKRPDPRRPATTQKSEPKTERQIVEDRKARDAARKKGEITFDDLKFDIEKDGEFKQEMITKELKELDKKIVKLRGFILPTSVFQQSGIKQFVLVRDNQECCFGPGAALYDCVIIEMVPGKTTNFATRVVTVKGKLEIDTNSYQYPDGGYYAIYRMTAEEVK